MWSFLVFFTWILFFWMLFAVIGDIFRRHDISGWGKAGWIIFTVFLPFLGIFVYLIANSKGMAERNMKAGAGCAGRYRRVHQVGRGQCRSGGDDREGARTAGKGRTDARPSSSS